MGLLDQLLGAPGSDQSQAISLLAAGLMKRDVGGGLLAANQLFSPEAKMKREMMQAQIDETRAQADGRKAAMAEAQRQAMIQQQIPSLYRQPGMSGGQPVPQEAGGVPMFSQPMGAAPMRQAPGGFDVQAALRLGMKPDDIAKYAGLDNLGRAEVARTIETMRGGKPVTVQYDKYGQEVGGAQEQWKAPVFQNLGNRTAAIDPVSLQQRGSFAQGQSPDSVASNAISIRGQNMTDARARQTAELGAIPSGYRRTMDGKLEFTPGGPADPNTPKSKANLTEDQGKATGWLVQAENAWKNMQKVGLDKDGNVTSAARPGFNDALAAIPSFGATGSVANLMRGADRQKFMQATSSLSEALLRAATGAGVNKEEAAQKIHEITPVFGEDAETTKQKMGAIPLYLESLRVRAGPGATKAALIVGGHGQPASDPNDPLGLRR